MSDAGHGSSVEIIDTVGGSSASVGEVQDSTNSASAPVGDDLGDIPEDVPLEGDNMAPEPPNDPDAPMPPPGTDPTQPPTNGDQYGPVPQAEVAADPLDEVPSNGWFDYEYSDDLGNSTRYGGTTTASDGALAFNTKLATRLAADFPQFDDIERHTNEVLHTGTFYQINVGATWGIGERQASSFATQASYLDTRAVNLLTTNPATQIVPTVEDTILYKVQAGITITGSMVRQETVFSSDEVRRLKTRINDIGVAERYRDLTTTSVVRGDNHVAFLTIAYTRIIALAAATEQSLPLLVRGGGASFNKSILTTPSANATPFRAAVNAYLQYRPNALITLPPGSRYGDISTMLYLMGNGRIIFKYKPEDEEKAIYSPFDRFVAGTRFMLAPLLENSAIPEYEDKNYKWAITLHGAQDLLTRYVDKNQLWTQMAIARNMAWGMVVSREFSSSLSLPKPVHSMDTLLGTVNLGSDHITGRRVIRQDDPVSAILVAGTWLCEAMIEAMFEGCVNTIEESAGIGPHARNFLAAIDMRQDELGLDLRIGSVILPVVDRITGTASTHVKQFLDTSIVSMFKNLAIGWETRPIRYSSYLAIGTKPEDEALQTIFSSSKRLALTRQRLHNWREAVITPYLLTSVPQSQLNYLQYGKFYDDDISRQRIYAVKQGTLGTHQVKYMRGDPTLWDFWCNAEYITIEPEVEVVREEPSGGLTVDQAATNMFAALREAILAAEEKKKTAGKQPPLTRNRTTPDTYMATAVGPGQYPIEDVVDKGKAPVRNPPSPVEDSKAGRPGTGFTPTARKLDPITQGWAKPSKPARKIQAKQPTGPNVLAKNKFYTLKVEDTTAGSYDEEKVSASHNLPRPRSPRTNRVIPTRDIKAAERRQAKRDEEAMSAAIAINLSERERMIRDFPADMAEARAIDMLFPRGKDAELKRAPYTIGSLLFKLRTSPILTRQMKADISTFIRAGAGGKNAWAVAVVQFITMHELTTDAYEKLVELGLLTTPYEHWNDKWSNINDMFRNMVHTESWPFSETDFPQCLYLAGFVGRPHREADWEEEKRKRSAQPAPLRKYTSKGFVDMTEEDEKRMILNFLYSEASFRTKRVQPFEEYYKSRAEWMIRGSMSGEKTVLDTLPEVRSKMAEFGLKVQQNTNKVHVAEKVDYEWFKSVLEMEPVHLAKAHTKGQENGKIRSIQGSVYSHYVIGNYWSRHLETTMTLKHATMNKSNSQLLLEKEDRRLASLDSSTTKVCLDYPDFGATHSLRQQSLVLDCMLEVAVAQGFKPTDEFLTIHQWYRDSFKNQWWTHPGTTEWYKTTMSMFSGVVQTTCFNTVLNGAMRMHACETLNKMGSPVLMKRNYELGDDGWAEFATREQADAYIAVFPLIGKTLNPIKQLVSCFASEYLREWYINGKVYGCFARALAMLVSGNVESTIASAGLTRIRELYESYCTLHLRLANAKACQYYFEDLATYEARRGTLGRHAVLRFCYAPADVGGLALRPIHSLPKDILADRQYKEGEMPTFEDQEKRAADVLLGDKVHNLFKASRDYINIVERKHNVTWKHSGKAKATALVAASGITTGAKVTQATHEELEFLVLQCGWRKISESEIMDEVFESRPVSIGVHEIERQFHKATVEDKILLSELSKLSKIFKFMSDETQDRVINDISEANNIPASRIRKTLQSLKYLRGEGFEYAPKSLLNSELMGIYSQWKVITSFGKARSLPKILLDLSPAYHT
ncbi:hypothetical protein [Alternaria botybirnavirus 1]|nr:hypothetical protein [Alternaria botybirnavirus 1]